MTVEHTPDHPLALEPGDARASTPPAPPTLYLWAGGLPAFERLTAAFYGRIPADPLLGPVFAHMDPAHPAYVARFLAEVFRGPAAYTAERGGHATMLAHHLRRHLTQEQRRRWVSLLLECADDVGLPDDPECRSAFVAYLEWGSRLAVLNSQDDVTPVLEQPMPSWGWGEVGGPYQG
jgi:hemoglobin